MEGNGGKSKWQTNPVQEYVGEDLHDLHKRVQHPEGEPVRLGNVPPGERLPGPVAIIQQEGADDQQREAVAQDHCGELLEAGWEKMTCPQNVVGLDQIPIN